MPPAGHKLQEKSNTYEKEVLDLDEISKKYDTDYRKVIDEIIDKEDLIKAIFKKGLKNIVVSRASKDIYYGYNGKDIGIHKVKSPKNFKNTTGCGDALMSGIIDYLSLGKSIKEAVAFGDKLAKITLMSDFANSREITKFAHK